MPSLGDLVVRLTANTRQFDSRMKSSQSVVSTFARKSMRVLTDLRTLIAGAGIASLVGGSVKLAAETETLSKQFEVLTGSAERAKRVMLDINKFAASTPFQKLEIAEAGRKMLAFGSSSSEVVGELRMLGDIAAATGTPLGDLAEIYGKARVQGRLFAEDINQLTGRGIPVIGKFAEQFGVAQSEVKKLVEEGKIGFPELVRALQAMTSNGGQFAGMMEELSQTTAGKFSTFKDNIAALGVTIGTELLPAANDLLDWATDLIKNADIAAWADFTARSMKDLAQELGIVVEMAESLVKTGLISIAPREDPFGIQAEWKKLQKQNARDRVQERADRMPAPPIPKEELDARRKRADELLGPGQRRVNDSLQMAMQLGSLITGAAGMGISTLPDTNIGRFNMEAMNATQAPLQFAGAAERGSVESLDTLLRAMNQGGRKPQEQTNKLLADMNKKFDNGIAVKPIGEKEFAVVEDLA